MKIYFEKDLQNAFDDGYKARDAEIVRCKDCKRWKTDWYKGVYKECPNVFAEADWFCADGERMAVTQSNDPNVLDALDGKEQEDG